jgi:hypothetical protein
MSRTYRHLSTETHEPKRNSSQMRVAALALTCEYKPCDKPGILVIFPGLSELEAPCFCTEHLSLIA